MQFNKDKILIRKWKFHPLTILQIVAVLLSFSIGTSICGFKKVRHTYQEFAKYFPQCRAEQYSFHQNEVMLDTRKKNADQLLYIIRNVGNNTVYLEHPPENSGNSEKVVGWSSHLAPHHITAFAMDRDHFQLQCFVRERGVFVAKKIYKPVPCQMHISICILPTVDFVAGSKGTYWAAENFESTVRFAKKLHKRGIYW